MRLSRVEVERFLGFRHVTMDLDTNLQLVAGPNNAGKSSLIRLIETFFSDPSGDALRAMLPLNTYYSALGSRTLSTIRLWFSDLSTEEKTAFGSLVRQDGQVWFSIQCSRAGNLKFGASRATIADQARTGYLALLDRFHFVKIPSVRVGGDGERGEAQSLERFLNTLESVLIRSGSSRSTALQQEFAQAMAPVEALVRGVLDDSAASIAADLPFREQQVKFRLPDTRFALRGMLESAAIESGGQVTVSVAERGTGFQSALVLGILRFVAERESHQGGNVLFAIEEPEAFLHPQTQRAMAKILADVSADAQVLVTTHSSVLVDSFSIGRIARLPLQPEGVEHHWSRPRLDKAVEGRLSRYCNAANSELVFANSVIFVEGESDFLVVERLLSHATGAAGGHYALGITVVDADGVGKIKHLVSLARHFGVTAFVVADKDSIKKASGQRVLLAGMAPELAAAAVDVQKLHQLADQPVSSLIAAMVAQQAINGLLEPVNAFVMSSDLEGALLDSLGLAGALEVLGPGGEEVIDATFAAALRVAPDGLDQLRSWMGSKGWNADQKPSGKLQPHVAPVLADVAIAKGTTDGLQDLMDLVARIVADASRAPV